MSEILFKIMITALIDRQTYSQSKKISTLLFQKYSQNSTIINIILNSTILALAVVQMVLHKYS